MSGLTMRMLTYQIEATSKAITDIGRGIEEAREQIRHTEAQLAEQQEHLSTLRALRDTLTSGRITGPGQPYPAAPATGPMPPIPDGPVQHDPGDPAIRDRIIALTHRLGQRAELRAGDGTVLARGVLDTVDARCVYIRDLEAGRGIVGVGELHDLVLLQHRRDTGAWGADQAVPEPLATRAMKRLTHRRKPGTTPQDGEIR